MGLNACSNKISPSSHNGEIIGDWKLIEVLMDPGDGSGEFEISELEVIVSFNQQMEVKANGILCGFGSQSITPLTGVYSISDSMIVSQCEGGELKHIFRMDKGNLIIQNRHCREACLAKLIKK